MEVWGGVSGQNVLWSIRVDRDEDGTEERQDLWLCCIDLISGCVAMYAVSTVIQIDSVLSTSAVSKYFAQQWQRFESNGNESEENTKNRQIRKKQRDFCQGVWDQHPHFRATARTQTYTHTHWHLMQCHGGVCVLLQAVQEATAFSLLSLPLKSSIVQHSEPHRQAATYGRDRPDADVSLDIPFNPWQHWHIWELKQSNCYFFPIN